MPTERLASLAGAVALVAALLIGGGIGFADPWDKAAHFAVFSLLTFLLWHATGGSMPALVCCAVLLLGALDEWRQAYLPGRFSDARDFLADLCGVLCTGTLLFMQRKTVCAESSPR
jgi:VanZ family protein